MEVPKEMLEDFRNHLWACFKYLGLGEPTPVQYIIAQRLQEKEEDFQLQAGRGFGKSVISSCFVSWLLLKNPNRTILVTSATADRAAKFISQTRNILRLVPYCKQMEPQDFDKDNAFGFNLHNRTVFSQDLNLTARGITSQITGLHADDIIADDLEIPENSDSPAAREKLYNKIQEFEQVRNKTQNGRVIFLGTPQTKDSIYIKLKDNYNILKFPSEMPDINISDECEDVDDYIMNLGIDAGEPTQPERFSKEVLKKVEAKIGPTLYALNYKLITTLADNKKYPLRLQDLVVLDTSPELFPEKVVWANAVQNKRVPSYGMKDDLVYEPMWVSDNFVEYDQTAMFIDPSGRGSDETAICVASTVNGYIVIHELFGLPGGYDTATLEKIAKVCQQYGIKMIRYESNFGDGMFGQLLRPVIAELCGPVAVEEYRVTGAKEKRILNILEPVMAQHKLVFNTKAIKDQETQKQITRLTERRGALKHDDRVDVISACVSYWVDNIGMNPDTIIEKNKQKEHEDNVKEWISNKRVMGLLGDRISGAILYNGKPVKESKYKSILKRNRL